MDKRKYFGTDGVRGRVGVHPMVPDFIVKLGYGAGIVLARGSKKHPTFLIGRDTRQSGEMLQNALTTGLLASGATVIDLGVMTTPGIAFMVNKLNADAGVVISASHNPVDENGIKFFNNEGMKLNEVIELAIEALIYNEIDLSAMHAGDFGRRVDGSDMRELYIEDLVNEHVDLKLDDLTLVLDCANGAASWYAPEAFSRLGARVVAINASPTGMNINNKAGSEHVRSHPEELATLIDQYNANFGVVFDGDADRVIFVDEKGNLVDGDHMLAIMADFLQKRDMLSGNTVVSTDMANGALQGYFEKHGINFIETPVGDKYVMEELVKLQQNDTERLKFGLGGEQSGHIILMDGDHKTGDGIRSALYIMHAYLEAGIGSLSAMAENINKYPQLVASANVESKPDLETIVPLKEAVLAMITELPGLTRKSLRYSGTEPKFRVMLEADKRHTAQELAEKAWQICRIVQAASGTEKSAIIEVLNVTRGGLMYPANKE
ncbi:MAG: phosphoglucosamine mutase [Anaerolineaceae bacterium]|nr:phosphoglucosamine mutase [Anaerolineaceae bacterium]